MGGTCACSLRWFVLPTVLLIGGGCSWRLVVCGSDCFFSSPVSFAFLRYWLIEPLHCFERLVLRPYGSTVGGRFMFEAGLLFRV